MCSSSYVCLQDFFFRFPWNNFLHNVVYDVVQQVFNGQMDRGFNRGLAIDLFETGRITERIIEGQKESDKVQAETNMRLGYMGHLTLIAEEVVKFTERHPPELISKSVLDKVMSKSWIEYVEQTLAETRERDNAILGGVRPDIAGGPGRQAFLISAVPTFMQLYLNTLSYLILTNCTALLPSIPWTFPTAGPDIISAAGVCSADSQTRATRKMRRWRKARASSGNSLAWMMRIKWVNSHLKTSRWTIDDCLTGPWVRLIFMRGQSPNVSSRRLLLSQCAHSGDT